VGYLASVLFSLFAICFSLRIVMIWTMRKEEWSQQTTHHEKTTQRKTRREKGMQRKARREEWRRRRRRNEAWKQWVAVAAVLFFAFWVVSLIWPLVAKK
jgi:hypothetical protein